MSSSLSNLKPGDKVILRDLNPWFDDQITTIYCLTTTKIIAGNCTFNISDGYQVGERWNHYVLVPATPDQIAEVESRQQIKQDQKRVYGLAVQVGERAFASSHAADAIPHLEAAFSALQLK